MTLDEYQQEAARTGDAKKDFLPQLATLGLGIAGEAGEVADEVKKVFGHGHVIDREKLRAELGDVLWYVSQLARHLGLTLEEVAVGNVVKLRARYPDGFSQERSRNRAAVGGV